MAWELYPEVNSGDYVIFYFATELWLEQSRLLLPVQHNHT